MYMLSPVLSTVENDLATVFACGISRFCKKSNALFLYFNHSQKVTVYSFCLKSISCMLVTYIPTLTVSGFTFCACDVKFKNNKLKMKKIAKHIVFFIFCIL